MPISCITVLNSQHLTRICEKFDGNVYYNCYNESTRDTKTKKNQRLIINDWLKAKIKLKQKKNKNKQMPVIIKNQKKRNM